LPQSKRDEFIEVLKKMYDTPEWTVVRDRNGWAEDFRPGDEFVTFLEQQEQEIGDLMRELGFLR